MEQGWVDGWSKFGWWNSDTLCGLNSPKWGILQKPQSDGNHSLGGWPNAWWLMCLGWLKRSWGISADLQAATDIESWHKALSQDSAQSLALIPQGRESRRLECSVVWASDWVNTPDTVLEGDGRRYQSETSLERGLVLLTVRLTTLLLAVLKYPSYLLGGVQEAPWTWSRDICVPFEQRRNQGTLVFCPHFI